MIFLEIPGNPHNFPINSHNFSEFLRMLCRSAVPRNTKAANSSATSGPCPSSAWYHKSPISRPQTGCRGIVRALLEQSRPWNHPSSATIQFLEPAENCLTRMHFDFVCFWVVVSAMDPSRLNGRTPRQNKMSSALGRSPLVQGTPE